MDISGQGLTSLPTEFFEDKRGVKVFDVSDNGLTGALPAEIRKMESLEELIALTGYGQIEDKMKAREAGFDHHLTKPVPLQEIEKLLRQSG